MDIKEKSEFESFVSGYPGVSFMQSEMWSHVKKEWGSERIVVKDENGNIQGAVQLLIKKIPVLDTAFVYAPRGPVCDLHDKNVLAKLTEQMKIVAKKYHAFMIRIDPMIYYTDNETVEILKSLGYRYDANRSEDNMIQSQKNYVLNIAGKTSEQVFDNFHSKWRYNIRTAIRKGVKCTYDSGDLDSFSVLMKETGERDNFNIRSKEYFDQVLTAFGDNARLYMCYSPEGNPLSGAVSVNYGGRVNYVYGASTSRERNLMPNHLMQWQMISWAIETGCSIYDFMGVPHYDDETHSNYGVYRFKKGFNGEAVKYAGEFDLILNELKYRAAKFALGLKGYKKI